MHVVHLFENVIPSSENWHHKSSIIQNKKPNKNRKICKITAIKKELDIQLFFFFSCIFFVSWMEELWHTMSLSCTTVIRIYLTWSLVSGWRTTSFSSTVASLVTEWTNEKEIKKDYTGRTKKGRNQTTLKKKMLQKMCWFSNIYMIYFSDINFRCED